MESEAGYIPNNDIAKEIVDSSNSLESQLGKDWKKRCVLNSINDVFTPNELNTINKGIEPILNEQPTDVDKWAVIADEVFKNGESSYRALVFKDDKDKQKVYIEGNAGTDKLYLETSVFSANPLGTESTLITFGADRIGFKTQDGKILSIDNLLKSDEIKTDLVFQSSSRKKTRTNMAVSFKENGEHVDSGIICALPENSVDVGVLFHEIGHIFRSIDFKNKPEQQKAYSESYKKFEEIVESRIIQSNNQGGLSDFQVRKIKADEERGAWATGISIIREVGKEIDFEAGSTENIGNIIIRSEDALKTYDNVPYNISSHESKDNPIPSFSREMRKAARELREKIKKSKVDYSGIPNFNEMTGETIGGNPKKILETVDKLTRKI